MQKKQKKKKKRKTQKKKKYKKRTRRCRIHRRCREVVKEEHVKEEEAGVEGDGRDVEEVEDEAVEAVVATRSRWSSSRRRRMYIYSYVNGEFHVWCWHEAAYTVTRCSWAIQ